MEPSPTVRSFKSLVLATESPDIDEGTLQTTLSRAGYRIERTSFAGAHETLQRNQPDLFLIDASVEADAALELCKQVRESLGESCVPIVMLHQGAGHDWIGEACDAGVLEFLESAMHPALLERRLDSAIAQVSRLLEGEVLSAGPHNFAGSNREFAAVSAFPQLISVAIDHCRGNDEIVCVLAVQARFADSSPRRLPDTFANLLSSAVRGFEEQGLISHPRGRIAISRLDDGCFGLLLPQLGQIQDAARLGYWIHECLERESGSSCDSFRIGIATCPGDSNESVDLIRLAQKAATLDHSDEGSILNFHTNSTNRWVFERLTLERSLRNSIERDELVVYYQPKINIASRAVVGFEALVRWQHPELGMVSPAQFIPLAEETGLIVPIGEWVLETACRQVMDWTSAGFNPVRMAVNLSAVQFRKSSLCDRVAEILERTELPSSLLELEVTESMLMKNLKDTISTLQRLKAMGIYLSIDDFGTGYSSLSYLKVFPIDALKIDRSFVRDITAKPDDAAIATSIILMGRSLNLNVIAEGVETESQRAFLEVLQCDEFQGFLVSPPVPADKAEAFLTRAE